MSWWNQVWHVFRRDIARTWKVLLVFACLLVIASGHALEWEPMMRSVTSGASAFMVVCAVVAVVLAVLADSTTRADAFWAIQPLEASAVAMSKVVYAGMLVGACALAAVVVAHGWLLHLTDGMGRAGDTLFPALPLALLGFALLASSCSGFKWVALTCVAAVIALFVQPFAIGALRFVVGAVAWWAVTVGVLLAATVLLLWRYRSASLAPLPRVATGMSGLAVMIVPAFMYREPVMTRPPKADEARALDAVGLSIDADRLNPVTCDGGKLRVQMHTTIPVGWRVNFSAPVMRVGLLDGSTLVLQSPEWRELPTSGEPIVPVAGDTSAWSVLGASSGTEKNYTQMAVPLPVGGRTRICGKVARLALHVRVEAWTGAEVLRVPVSTGARSDAPGLRMTVLGVDSSDIASGVDVRFSRLAGGTVNFDSSATAVNFALLSPERRQLLRLHSESSQSWYQGAMPGLQRRVVMLHLVPHAPGPEAQRQRALWSGPLVLLAVAPVPRATGWKDVAVVLAPTP